jgi:3-hydroxyacyl-CoA dehydrogenase
MELALACHYRVAPPTAKLGLPEVTLGLLPGGGGTQRLPRLIGAAAAMDMLLAGSPVTAQVALQKGLLDAIVEGELLDAACSYASEVAARQAALPRASSRVVDAASVTPNLFSDMRTEVAKKTRGAPAPMHIVDCVEAAVEKPFDEGLVHERARFVECMNSPQSPCATLSLPSAKRAGSRAWRRVSRCDRSGESESSAQEPWASASR